VFDVVHGLEHQEQGRVRHAAGQFGYETIRGDASTSWFRLSALVLAASALAALLINRRLPS
jgi:hypothetical protein